MHPYTIANDDMMIAIRDRAYGNAAREMTAYGIALTHEQADRIGEAGIDWLRTRCGLRITTNETHVLCEVQR